jgi:8-oxo-dGTP diphosphatase
MALRKIVKSLIINSENSILLLKRSAYKGSSGENFWDLPGGSVDSDELPLNAIKRECVEELSINLVDFVLLSRHRGSYSKGNDFEFFLYVCDVKNNQLDIILSHEHINFDWVSLENIGMYKTKSEKRTIGVIVNFLENRKKI